MLLLLRRRIDKKSPETGNSGSHKKHVRWLKNTPVLKDGTTHDKLFFKLTSNLQPYGEHCILDEILLCVIGQTGVMYVIRQPLTESEAASLRKSAEDIVITQYALKTLAMT